MAMSYLSSMPADLKEKLLSYFYLSDVIYFVDNLIEFSYLNSKDKEYFWANIYHTFWSSQDVSYQNMLRRLDRQSRVKINERFPDMMMSHVIVNELDKNNDLLRNNDEYLNMAVSYGNLHFVKLLHNKGCEITFDMIELAGAYGHFEVLKYCFEHIFRSEALQYQPNLCALLCTVVQCAMQYDNGELVKRNRISIAHYLISKGADVNSLPDTYKKCLNGSS